MKGRIYFCIDMKTFFASVECAERGLNPFETNLVVADETRGRGALCLAVTPKMKASGVKNRCRVFQIPPRLEYITAKPRMKKYIEYAADIYAIYLKYIDKRNIHVYSIDEAFIDATDYLKMYGYAPKEFAKKLMNEIAAEKHIPSTCGIGTNLYLAKIALDITAKKSKDHIGFLDEETYRQTLWEHSPITDFWQVAGGVSKRLEKRGIVNMKGITEYPQELLYREFGVNAELLIDHAYGRESCTMSDIKSYKSKSKSLSNSQILFKDYTAEEAKTVILEMAQNLVYEMLSKRLITNCVGVYVGYSDRSQSDDARTAMRESTNAYSVIRGYVERLFDGIVDRSSGIRRLGITFENIVDEGCEGYDFFTDFNAVEKERKVQKKVVEIREKYGKNTVLRASDLQDFATAPERNRQIGGHNG